MAFLSPHYDHDLFISYSHGDFGRTGTSPLKEWSEQFVRELVEELQWNEEFRGLTVFLDQDQRPGHGVDPTAPLTDQIAHGISRSALLAVLMCNPYLQSRWCADELKLWHERHATASAGVDRRIFPIRVAPVDDKSWPQSLLDANGEPLPGFFFHDRRVQDPNVGRPFRWKGLTTNSDAFQDELMNVVTRMTVRLKEMREALNRQQRLEENARQLAEGGLVYLYGRGGDRPYWRQAWQDLDNRGYAVLPHQPEEDATDDLDWQRKEKARVDTLVGCDALLLVGGAEEKHIGRDMAAVGRHSRHLAKARSDKLLPCAVYDAIGSAKRSEVTRRTARQLGIEWIDAAPEGGWIHVMQTWLRQASEQLRRTA
jgi:hypothetical protein